ncbi:septation protein SepH [Dietzia sp. PP-33]|jgi:hypothetical protein|uniref:septation protein SepH n=1 Tax=Dietzia sp. PP-33 TaxID=2957500 RepID=UPI0029B22068|nr:septation protein SepH [Dietzia sp. PP-33]MDX2356811.1 septation protein SepH [Dietzia sp. PP-33]
MRKLRIIGVDADSSVVECEAPDSDEKFTLPLDDRFRAAARGEAVPSVDARRVPVTGTLRPREIQDRIRHGAAPEDVAADAGVPMSRIEGFAVPVLLERANAADLARSSHPVLPDGPALDTLAERVESALDHRGIDPDVVAWDAWRDRAGGWIVRTSWPAGLSDDASATWSFVPDSHGGSARALDGEAEHILDPSRATALRTVSSPPPLPPGPPPIRAVPAPGASPRREPAADPEEQSRPAAEHSPGSTTPVDDHFLQHPPAEPERRTTRRHPTMPSWEDVLLGVRGKDD